MLNNVKNELLTRDFFYKKVNELSALIRLVRNEKHEANKKWLLSIAGNKCYDDFMRTKILDYNVRIVREGKYFVTYVPTLGISDFGLTLEKAKKNTEGCIECYVEALTKNNEIVPKVP